MRRLEKPLTTGLLLALAIGCSSKISQKHARSSVAPQFVVEEIVPPDDAGNVSRDVLIEVLFSRTIDRDSLGDGLRLLPDFVIVERLNGGSAERVDGTYALANADTRVVFTPASPLDTPFVDYRITVLDGIRDLAGRALDLDGSLVPTPSIFQTNVFNDTVPPTFSGVTTLQAISSSALLASWELATDDVSTVSEIFYRVYRNNPPTFLDVDYTTPAVETNPEAMDALLTGLQPDVEYTVGVRAVDASGNESSNLETISASTLSEPPDITPPTFGGIEDLVTLSTTSLEARWTEATDDRDSTSNLRYNIYVGTGGSVDFGQPFLSSGLGDIDAQLTGLLSDTEYSVAVRAVDTTGNEDQNVANIDASTLTSFDNDVFPIISTPTIGGCLSGICHDADRPAGRLNLSTYDGLITGGRTASPPAVVPGDSIGSLLLWRTDQANPNFLHNRLLMPAGKPALSPEVLGTISRWIDQGALDN